MAYAKLKREHQDITFTETALVHEVYMKMIDQTSIQAESKNHFMAIAARCMRQILVDHARKKKADKRGGEKRDVTYIEKLLKVRHEAEELVDLNEKLTGLAKLDERMAEVVMPYYHLIAPGIPALFLWNYDCLSGANAQNYLLRFRLCNLVLLFPHSCFHFGS